MLGNSGAVHDPDDTSGSGVVFKLRLHAEAETEFFLAEVDAQISFVKGIDGKVTHLILHQNGREQKAEKIR